jgi:excisionase family DNA binding protein
MYNAAMMRQDGYITTNEAGDYLGVTRQRVLQLIQEGRLKAEKFGNVYMIQRADLSNIESKPMGRPPKAKAEVETIVSKPKRATKKGGRK